MNYYQTLANLRFLEDNWNGYGSDAPNQIALFKARIILDILLRSYNWPDRIGASAEGGIGFVFAGQKMIEIENDGYVTFTQWSGKDLIFIGINHIEKIPQILNFPLDNLQEI